MPEYMTTSTAAHNFDNNNQNNATDGIIYALFVWACLADKPWLKVLLADLV